MTYHALLEYIHKAKEQGSSDEEITAQVCAAGWYRVDAQDALALYGKLAAQGRTTMPMPTPSLPVAQERASLRNYVSHPATIATASFVVGFLGYLWLVP